jgi:hypothetical protein
MSCRRNKKVKLGACSRWAAGVACAIASERIVEDAPAVHEPRVQILIDRLSSQPSAVGVSRHLAVPPAQPPHRRRASLLPPHPLLRPPATGTPAVLSNSNCHCVRKKNRSLGPPAATSYLLLGGLVDWYSPGPCSNRRDGRITQPGLLGPADNVVGRRITACCALGPAHNVAGGRLGRRRWPLPFPHDPVPTFSYPLPPPAPSRFSPSPQPRRAPARPRVHFHRPTAKSGAVLLS